MKRNVEIEIPVPSRGGTIKLEGPCAYCGAPAVTDGNSWTGSVHYRLQKWGISNKFGTHELYDLKQNGVIQSATAIVQVPYCTEHIQDIKTFRRIQIYSSLLPFLATAIALFVIWSNHNPLKIGHYFLILVFSGFMAVLGYFVGIILGKIITLFVPKLRDYPVMLDGHWGFIKDGINIDEGELGIGPIRYYLAVAFLNVESAKRAIQQFPEAKITKGESLLDE